ncbi:peptidoglycan-binding protein [Mitsuaria sp. GD03876]|uniref:peptidoglycan-binding protein n=1 Tax=Mitsuaria sp. GD03876 TaxID=2975399 RepID=UPI002446CB29|nr:peptidoglycan-binding protein [Mitsuaria sp. GD03876]MDH0867537.1 chitosanase [Mitsuaria sp. GD03876]
MSRIWFAKGLRGEIARRIQLEALRQQFFVGDAATFVDGDFGNDTATALSRLQAARFLPVTGQVDTPTWQQLTHDALPTLFERCLGITADFEGHGFGLLQGNFDGAGLTWGVIGFTLSNGEIQQLLAEAEAASPGTLDRNLGPLASTWRARMAMPRAAQVAWADSISSGPNKATVPPEWKQAFARLGQEPVIQRLQMHRAYDAYFVPAAATARKLRLASELGVALAFDCHVQNGASRVQAVAELAPLAGTIQESDMRRRLANRVADLSSPAWREDVRGRKLTIANGGATFRGRVYQLGNWGLGEFAAA